MKDKLGRDIVVGSFIAYGHLLDRSAGLKIGKVLKVSTVKKEYTYKPEDRISVVGVDESYDWRPEKRELKLSKRGTLQYSNRLIVIDRNMVPEGYLKLLDTVETGDEK